MDQSHPMWTQLSPTLRHAKNQEQFVPSEYTIPRAIILAQVGGFLAYSANEFNASLARGRLRRRTGCYFFET